MGRLRHCFGALAALAVFASSVFALQDGAARTPPMGFNTWNYFGCNGINETNVMAVAQSLLKTHPANWESKVIGLKDVGYKYINLDDCWHSQRAADGTPQWNTSRFPHGFPWLTDTIHKMGLKMGIYTDCGTQTCAGYFGSYNNDQIDAETYVKWGFNYLKDDWCNIPSGYSTQAGCATLYSRMGHALVNAAKAADATTPSVDHKIIFSLCQWGNYNVYTWADSCGHLWRTTGDIVANWNSMIGNFHTSCNGYSGQGTAQYAKPGAWNDPDMLEVGNGSLTATENQSHFDMWCMVAAPLLLGNNTPAMTEATFTILSNREVIALDQDSLGYQARMTRSSGGIEVWSKKLNRTNSWAVMLLNTGGSTASGTVQWTDMPGMTATSVPVRDLHSHSQVSAAATDGYAVSNIPSHGTALLVFGTPYWVTQTDVKFENPGSAGLKGTILTRTLTGTTEIFIPSANSTLQVFNLLGKQIAGVTASRSFWYSLDNAKRGMYLVRLRGSNGATAEKTVFVK